MIRIVTLFLSLFVLIRSIRAYNYDKKRPEKSIRIVSFFLMLVAILIFLLALNDSMHTMTFLFKIIRGEIIHDPVWYPSRFPLWGQRTHTIDFIIFVVLSCSALLFAIRKRELIACRLSE